MKYEIKDLIKDNRVRFTHARKGHLWYETQREKFEFPVPFEDMGDATFPSEEKAMLFMRYIRKHLNTMGS